MRLNEGSGRTVRCPHCGGPARFAADNRWRPFCSERCRSQDLGAWASERFRIEGAPPEAPEGDATSPAPRD